MEEGSDSAQACKLDPGLYVVSTPIGNAADLTFRAVTVLAAVDLIACEDTRVTRWLLDHYQITAKTISYHEHNAEKVRPHLLARLAAGARVALVSDAGTPLISDPGYKLVREAIATGIPVIAAPGASAPLAALVVSGLPCDRFLFAGFLPAKTAARQAALAELAPVRATLILFESAQRLAETLADGAAVLGSRPAAVTRELTKRFEEVRRGSLPDLAAAYAAEGPPKGEVVVVIGPPDADSAQADAAALDRALRAALAGSSVRDAAETVARACGWPRRTVYARALALAEEARRAEPAGPSKASAPDDDA